MFRQPSSGSACFHCQLDALAFAVDAQHLDMHMLMNAYYCRRVAHKVVGELGNMHQTVFFDADVYKTSEVSNVCHNARQLHPFCQVIDRAYIPVEFEGLDFLPRVTPWLVEFLHDVV